MDATKQPSCPGLSLVMRAGFMIMTRRQRNNPPNDKIQTHRLEKVRQVKSKFKSMLIIFFNIKRIAHEEFVLAGQTVNSAYYCVYCFTPAA
jgi:hypothetical protein